MYLAIPEAQSRTVGSQEPAIPLLLRVGICINCHWNCAVVGGQLSGALDMFVARLIRRCSERIVEIAEVG